MDASKDQECLDTIFSIGKANDIPLIVPWNANKRFAYFSVLSEKRHYAPFGRVFVKHDGNANKFFCDCRKASKLSNCSHVIICKAYMETKGYSTVISSTDSDASSADAKKYTSRRHK